MDNGRGVESPREYASELLGSRKHTTKSAYSEECDCVQVNIWDTPEHSASLHCGTPTTNDTDQSSLSSPSLSSTPRRSTFSSSKASSPSIKSSSDSSCCYTGKSLNTDPFTLFLDYAAQAFSRGYSLPSVVSREDEHARILSSVKEALTNQTNDTPRILYVCGAPGTGKTTTVMHAMRDLEKDQHAEEFLNPKWNSTSCFMNAAMFCTATDFLLEFSQLLWPSASPVVLKKLIEESREKGLKVTLAALLTYGQNRRHTRSSSRKTKVNTVIVLDEADHLNQFNLRAFEGTKQRTNTTSGSSKAARLYLLDELVRAIAAPEFGSQVVLIAISNCLSPGGPLVDPLRPIQANEGNTYSPRGMKILVFEAYSAKALREILEYRLELARRDALSDLDRQLPDGSIHKMKTMEDLRCMNLFSKRVMLLALQKLASHQGDCRQMLDMCRTLVMDKLVPLQEVEHQTSRTDGKRPESCFPSTHSTGQQQDVVPAERIIGSPGKKPRSITRLDTSDSTSTTPSSPRDIATLSERIERISLTETQRVLDRHFQRPKTRCHNLIEKLPLQQQVLLCAICCTVAKMKKSDIGDDISMDVEVDSLQIQTTYNALCEKYRLPIGFLDTTQLSGDGLVGLEHTGILEFVQSTSLRRPRGRPQQNAAPPWTPPRRPTQHRRPTVPLPREPAARCIRLRFPEPDIRAALSSLKSVFQKVLTLTPDTS